MRGHQPVLIEEFNGLWRRGDAESCPLDHFSDCNNLMYIQSGFKTRDGLDVFPIGEDPQNSIFNVLRIYRFIHNEIESLLVLDALGNIYDTGSPTPNTPILTISGMIDFAMVNVANRAYISPHDGVTGMQNEFLYVYKGGGVTARKAGGAGPTGLAMIAATDAFTSTDAVEKGIHLFAVVYETDTGFLTKLGPYNAGVAAFTNYDAPGGFKVKLTNIPVSPDPFVVKRHIVATRAINPPDFTGDLEGYQFYFVPDGTIEDNVTTEIVVSFFDADLLDDAWHLLDLYEEIPAFVSLNIYHDRLIGCAQWADLTNDETFGDISTARVSYPGEYEAFDQVDGLIVTPLDGNPLTNGSEYRDVLYLFKKTRTYAYNDNGDAPSGWPLIIIDQGVGASVHGISAVLDSGGVNVEFLLIIDYSGIMLFNGAYQRPELSFKIRDYWFELERDDFKNIQIMNDSLSQRIYVSLPNKALLYADYTNGLDPEKIRYCPWKFPNEVTTIALINTNTLVIGARKDLSV